ncbi:MAG: hypothetical protein J6O51_05760 [Bacteroidales bacterium]|nr:hypothetical protein [Bacteroidales bacterium]
MKKFILTALLCTCCFAAFCQEVKTPEQKEKELYEAVQAQVDKMTESLKLDLAQVFYVDSILTHDYRALQQEFEAMSAAKVTNTDLFYDVQDKWSERMYQALHKVLNEEQWKQYLKSGAARDKKARDKRAAKKNK